MSNEQTFGDWLRETREASGFATPAEFARAIDKTRSYVEQLEGNKINPSSGKPLRPSLAAVDKIAEVLGVSPSLARDKAGLGVHEPAPVAAEEVQLIRDYRALTPKVKPHALAAFKAFKLLSTAGENKEGAEKKKPAKKRPKQIKEKEGGEKVPVSDKFPRKRSNGEREKRLTGVR